MPIAHKKARVDGQMTGLSAEFFVAAELLKRDIQTSVTFGAAKAIDLLAYNAKTKKSFTLQVKALRSPNYFLVQPAKVNIEHIYAFVLLNQPGKPVEYFIVPGDKLLQDSLLFDKYFNDAAPMPGIHSNSSTLRTFRDKWDIFLE